MDTAPLHRDRKTGRERERKKQRGGGGCEGGVLVLWLCGYPEQGTTKEVFVMLLMCVCVGWVARVFVSCVFFFVVDCRKKTH